MSAVKFGFQQESEAKGFLYEVWRTFDIDVRNPQPPTDAISGDSERWLLGGSHVLYWSFGTKRNDIHMQAAGMKQFPAFVVFDKGRSHVPDHYWSELGRVARGYNGESVHA